MKIRLIFLILILSNFYFKCSVFAEKASLEENVSIVAAQKNLP